MSTLRIILRQPSWFVVKLHGGIVFVAGMGSDTALMKELEEVDVKYLGRGGFGC